MSWCKRLLGFLLGWLLFPDRGWYRYVSSAWHDDGQIDGPYRTYTSAMGLYLTGRYYFVNAKATYHLYRPGRQTLQANRGKDV